MTRSVAVAQNQRTCSADSTETFTYYDNDGVVNSLAPATVTIRVRCASPAAIAAIPTLSEWGLILLATLLALAVWWRGPMMRTGRR